MYKRVKVIVKNPVQLVMPTRKKTTDILQELVKNDILFSSVQTLRGGCPCGIKAITRMRKVTFEAQVELVGLWEDRAWQSASTELANQW